MKDPRNYSLSYFSVAWDIRHSMTSSFLYDLPFGRDKKLMADASKLVDNVLAAGN
ncbi:MAG: hypothetical protein NTV52_00555 [Acidobacteria bacterium]|nr:hypothetical protein [Acidobacteriota bacterium]